MIKNILLALAALFVAVLLYNALFGGDDHEHGHPLTPEQAMEECVNFVDEAGETQYTEEECTEMVSEVQGKHDH